MYMPFDVQIPLLRTYTNEIIKDLAKDLRVRTFI